MGKNGLVPGPACVYVYNLNEGGLVSSAMKGSAFEVSSFRCVGFVRVLFRILLAGCGPRAGSGRACDSASGRTCNSPAPGASPSAECKTDTRLSRSPHFDDRRILLVDRPG
jgi:hypothetical protein